MPNVYTGRYGAFMGTSSPKQAQQQARQRAPQRGPKRKPYDSGLNGAVAAIIRGHRAMADLTIPELADLAGVDGQSLRRYLATERAFNLEVLDAVARALGVTAADVTRQAQDRLAQQRESELYDAVRAERPLSGGRRTPRKSQPARSAVAKKSASTPAKKAVVNDSVKKVTRGA